MADNLSTLFGNVVAHSEDTKYTQDLIYRYGFSDEEATYIVMTANKLIDNYPSQYKTYNQAIRAAINILIQKQQQQQQYQGGGQLKHTKPRKVSRNKKSNVRQHSSKRNNRRTIKNNQI